jgi:hypothetical protein
LGSVVVYDCFATVQMAKSQRKRATQYDVGKHGEKKDKETNLNTHQHFEDGDAKERPRHEELHQAQIALLQIV